jgi:ABC-type molybdenum transport system ATPase subunit/photorepair protein PhrA
VVLAGANGAGKTSLLNILAGLHIISPPDAACVLGYRAFEDYRELNQHVVLLSQEWRQTLKCLNSGGYATFSAVTQGPLSLLYVYTPVLPSWVAWPW